MTAVGILAIDYVDEHSVGIGTNYVIPVPPNRIMISVWFLDCALFL